MNGQFPQDDQRGGTYYSWPWPTMQCDRRPSTPPSAMACGDDAPHPTPTSVWYRLCSNSTGRNTAPTPPATAHRRIVRTQRPAHRSGTPPARRDPTGRSRNPVTSRRRSYRQILLRSSSDPISYLRGVAHLLAEQIRRGLNHDATVIPVRGA